MPLVLLTSNINRHSDGALDDSLLKSEEYSVLGES
jgi:hypothetical protein